MEIKHKSVLFAEHAHQIRVYCACGAFSHAKEVLQIHSHEELRSPQCQGRRPASVFAEHHDGSEEVLQPPLPVPRCLNGGTSGRQWHLRDARPGEGVWQNGSAVQDAAHAEGRGSQVGF